MCDVRCIQEARSRNYFETHQIICDANWHLNNTASARRKKVMSKPNDNRGNNQPPQEKPDSPIAWVRVLAAFLILIPAWGPSLGYGAFQSFYLNDLLSDYSSSTISWIGSVQTCLLIATGFIAGPLCDRGWLRVLLILASLGLVVGPMLLSLCTEYYQVFLSQGILMGFCAGLAYTPALSMVNVSFVKHRAIAVGLAATGTSVGRFTPCVDLTVDVADNSRRRDIPYHDSTPPCQCWFSMDYSNPWLPEPVPHNCCTGDLLLDLTQDLKAVRLLWTPRHT
jgi:hypothetical protein